MATVVLQSQGKGKDNGRPGRPVDVTNTVTASPNNARLYTHTDGETYERVGTDGSGNAIYRNQKRERI